MAERRTPTDEHTAREALDPIERHEAPMATDETILVEAYGREVVLNACLGHKANETLGRLLSALIGQQTGSSVGLETDPYRIELEVPSGIYLGDIVDLLFDTDPDHVEPLIELSLKNADSLKFTLAQVAAKFGALKRWGGRVAVASDATACWRHFVTRRFTTKRSGRHSTSNSMSTARVGYSSRSVTAR
ncbi:MAG: hypothetical protein U5K28_11675 [Halobacteriales archaeon]|nr:hypothetical protein [Halobacteriales archaeon]